MQFIQVGEIGTRDPKTGEFLDSKPLYMEATDGLLESRAITEGKLSTIFAEGFIAYTKGLEAEGVIV